VPIQSGDVKLVSSQVMLDVPEGGGAPSAAVINDGVSNSIFPDISELDRAAGRVNLRKVFAAIQTTTTDGYYGANMIVADPPDDPRVSVTLFSTESTFDQRDEATARVESYLNKGGEWAGYLWENHIAGQRVIQLFQRTTAPLPIVGQTLVMVQNEGLSTEKEQYVRMTAITVETRTFYDVSTGDYQANVVTCDISDALRYDFTGSPASRSYTRASTGTKIRDTVVADAGTYVGVVPLTAAADTGDFTVSGSSIYTQLVPSAQTETPLSDIRSNGLSTALIPTGSALTTSITMTFTTSQSMQVGGPIYPGSLSVVRSGVTVTDSGGVLINGSAEVGIVDYDNGILTLTTNVWGTSGGTHTVTFIPATAPDLISEQRAIRVTAANRSQSYALTLEDPPVARTLTVSYLAQGRWYVLRDTGGGVLKGIDSSYGAGTVNYTTGSVVITLGALPDVGSAVVLQSFSDATTIAPSNTSLQYGGKAYFAVNSDGDLTEEDGSKSFNRNSVAVTWMYDGQTKTASDDGFGQLTGDATGTVDYTAGVLRLSPTLMPAAGTTFIIGSDRSTPAELTNIPTASGITGYTNITPGSLLLTVYYTFTYGVSGLGQYKLAYTTNNVLLYINDDASGNLFIRQQDNTTLNVGTINYVTGVFTLTATPISRTPSLIINGPDATALTFVAGGSAPMSYTIPWVNLSGRTVSMVPTAGEFANGRLAGTSSATSSAPSVIVNQYLARSVMVPNYTLKGVRFGLGSTQYVQLTDNTLVHSPSPTAGGGTPAGSVTTALGLVTMSYWPTGASPTLLNWRGLISPPTVGVEAPFMTFSSVFRTAASPLRPSSLSVLGTMQDGTQFNVTADANGKINGTRVKGRVDYEYGLVELYFVNPTGNTSLNVDLTFLGISGLSTIPADLALVNSVRYNAVAYSYLPLDADLIGIDPVRLPTDGRVPIFRPGSFAVVGHTGTIGPVTVSVGQTLNAARTRLSRVRVIGNNGSVINTGYTANLDAGTITFTDIAGYSQPIRVEHRIEDMALVSDAQISGEITFTRALTHDYPMGSYISSALVAGDLQARVSVTFDQATWSNAWSDTVSGSAATGTYNTVLAPISVTNRGALTERWALQFTSTSTFNIIGEHIGVIGTGSINSDTAPVNPATGVPYFSISAIGWGLGWATGNALRFNTVGAEFPVWVVRTILQGPETVANDSFTLLIRGDVDRP